MNELPNREVALFSAALELDASQRGAYLDEACTDDPALRVRLEALLRVHQKALPFLGTPASGAQASPVGSEVPGGAERRSSSPAEKTGNRIGRDKLLQQIGEGGCGMVYVAELSCAPWTGCRRTRVLVGKGFRRPYRQLEMGRTEMLYL